MAKSDNIKTLESKIRESVALVATKNGRAYFYRDEVVVQAMKESVVHALLRNLNPVVREIVVRWIESTITDALQEKDPYGIRLYENYPTLALSEDDGYGGARRWVRVGSQNATMFKLLAKQPEREARQLMAKSEVYIEISEQLETLSKRAGQELTWDDVRDQIGPRLAVLRTRITGILHS